MNTSPRSTIALLAAFVALVIVGAASRLVGLPENFAAIGAVALFAGWLFPSRMVAAGAVVGAMLLSDAFLGAHDWRLMLFTYGGLLAPVFIGRMLPDRVRGTGLLMGAAGGAAAFFLISNFGVWVTASEAAYPKTAAGLGACYAMGLPFLRATLAGDVVFTLVIFGAHALLTRRTAQPAYAA